MRYQAGSEHVFFLSVFISLILGADLVEVSAVLGKMGLSLGRPAQKGFMVSFVR